MARTRKTKTAPEDIYEKTLRGIAADYLSIIRYGFLDDPPKGVDSPIEIAMYLAFVHEATGGGRRLDLSWASDWTSCDFKDHSKIEEANGAAGIVYSQCAVGRYRADFLVCVRHEWECHKLDRVIAVECDGHDFHHATKEQVERDKSRDRYFAEQGILLMRFPGSEIYRNAVACVDQIAKVAEKIRDDWHSQAVDIEHARWLENK